MFVYEFKSTSCLISKIVISGLYLTIYTSRSSAAELEGTIQKLNLHGNISADHPKHVFCHNSHIDFSARGDSIPHKHLKFNNISSIKEIPAQMKALINVLIEVQQDSSIRRLEFDNLLHEANEQRISFGHAVFPEYIQEAFDNYDFTSPYISLIEREDFLASLDTYYSQDYNIQQNTLVQHAEDFLSTHWDVIHSYGFGRGKIKNEQEQNISDYYKTLLSLRNTLLKININQNDYSLYYEAANHIDKLKKNPNFDTLLPFSQDISDIERYLSEKASALPYAYLSAGIAITTEYLAKALNPLLSNSLFNSQKPQSSVIKCSDPFPLIGEIHTEDVHALFKDITANRSNSL